MELLAGDTFPGAIKLDTTDLRVLNRPSLGDV
jgi:hypothetical protein